MEATHHTENQARTNTVSKSNLPTDRALGYLFIYIHDVRTTGLTSGRSQKAVVMRTAASRVASTVSANFMTYHATCSSNSRIMRGR